MYVFQVLAEDSTVVAAKCFAQYPTQQQREEVIAQCLPEELVFAYHSERVVQL
jgi:hypothetical protein